jgi:hypothetical protein
MKECCQQLCRFVYSSFYLSIRDLPRESVIARDLSHIQQLARRKPNRTGVRDLRHAVFTDTILSEESIVIFNPQANTKDRENQ